MSTTAVRVRFAPSPTGFMHLGNVRAAVINYLFAKQHNGSFILRIEDTDAERNVDHRGTQILADLAWLNLPYDEGPITQGPYAPYYQSERSSIYAEHLKTLIAANKIYRCFCTTQELERKRQRQIASKMPPRYDRTCAHLSEQDIAEKLSAATPFIWRFKLEAGTVTINDLARGSVTFDFKNFSDFPLTRQDHSFTFIFANFVDDLTMHITHVFRGEDHLTNTAVQAALYQAFNAPLPVFWHLPLMCNNEGKKLSKRDFGFSLNDLRDEGYLPEAICNYLATIGLSLEHEIMDLSTMITQLNFKAMASTGQVRYDLAKLRWINHAWIRNMQPNELAQRCQPLLHTAYPEHNITLEKAQLLLKPLQEELTTLHDCVEVLRFIFEKPTITEDTTRCVHQEPLRTILASFVTDIQECTSDTWAQEAVQKLTSRIKEHNMHPKDFFGCIRTLLTGKAHGPSIKELLLLLGKQESSARLHNALQ